jgi:hypothetical protein
VTRAGALLRPAGLAALLLVPGGPAAAQFGLSGPKDSLKRAAIGDLISDVEYGVPESPAFELLPDRPTEVVHVVTPKDFKSAIGTWKDGSKLRIGAALDSRPLVRKGGSLQEYQQSWLRQAAFRSVLSAGVSAATEGSTDAVVAAGLRIPLIDRGDPRADPELNRRLANAYNSALANLPQPGLRDPLDSFVVRSKKAAASADTVRQSYGREHWNSLKLELGAAASVQAASASISRDSIQANRAGVWGALALPVLRLGQLTLSGKAAWISAELPTDESSRHVVGARLRLFPSEQLSLSGEFARIWSNHDDAAALDQRWDHLAVVAEWYVPELRGWLGVAYGGEITGDVDRGDQLSLTYALYAQRLLEPR